MKFHTTATLLASAGSLVDANPFPPKESVTNLTGASSSMFAAPESSGEPTATAEVYHSHETAKPTHSTDGYPHYVLPPCHEGGRGPCVMKCEDGGNCGVYVPVLHPGSPWVPFPPVHGGLPYGPHPPFGPGSYHGPETIPSYMEKTTLATITTKPSATSSATTTAAAHATQTTLPSISSGIKQATTIARILRWIQSITGHHDNDGPVSLHTGALYDDTLHDGDFPARPLATATASSTESGTA